MIQLAIPSRRTVTLKGMTASQQAGLRYERRVSAWLENEYGMVSQIEFERKNYGRFIPDGLIFSPGFRKLVVVEIKTCRSHLGAQQLRNYVSWLKEWFHGSVMGLEVCGNYQKLTGREAAIIHEPVEAFDYPYSILPRAIKLLPKVRKSGLGMADSTTNSALRATGGIGDCTRRKQRNSVVAVI